MIAFILLLEAEDSVVGRGYKIKNIFGRGCHNVCYIYTFSFVLYTFETCQVF